MHALSRVAAVSVVVLGGGMASGQCEPVWSEVFTPGEFDGEVMSAAVFDDGGAPRLVVSGDFRGDDGMRASSLRLWDGEHWSFLRLPTQPEPGRMARLHAVNGASEPRLIVAQDYAREPRVDVNVYAGGVWTTLTLPLESTTTIRAVVGGADPESPEMYITGLFDLGNSRRTKVMRWDGQQWLALDRSSGYFVGDLVWFDDGRGDALYVSTDTTIDNIVAHGVARWDGAQWSEVGGGCPAELPQLAVHDDGSGPALWAIDFLGGVLAKWDGVAWSSFSIEESDGFAWELVSAEVGGVRELIWTNLDGVLSTIWRWDGADGERIGGVIDGRILTLAPDVGGEFGGGVIAGGNFFEPGGVPACHVAGLGAGGWRAVGSENVGNGGGGPMVVIGPEGGEALGNRVYCASKHAGGRWAKGLASWDGREWRGLGTDETLALTAIGKGDLGQGLRIFGGSAGGGVHAWDGESWRTVGDGVEGAILTIACGVVGSDAPAVYIGGQFNAINGEPFYSVAAVDENGWRSLGGGLPSVDGRTTWVDTLAIHDDGTGPALYAGGAFDYLEPGLASGVLRWDGTEWKRVGFEFGDGFTHVNALISTDLGSGPTLYAGGSFSAGSGWENVYSWSGVAWLPVGGGLPDLVTGFSRIDLEGRPYLAASVSPRDGGGAANVWLWDDSSWAPFDVETNGRVLQLANAAHEGDALYITGGFSVVDGVPSEGIARWGCECAADFNGDGVADTRDFIAFLNAWAAGDDRADFDGNGVVDTRDFIAFLNAWSAGC